MSVINTPVLFGLPIWAVSLLGCFLLVAAGGVLAVRKKWSDIGKNMSRIGLAGSVITVLITVVFLLVGG